MNLFTIRRTRQTPPVAEDLPEGLKTHLQPLTSIFNTLNIPFIPNIFLANIFDRVLLIDETGAMKPDLTSPTANDIVRFYCGPDIEQRHIMIDIIPKREPDP